MVEISIYLLWIPFALLAALIVVPWLMYRKFRSVFEFTEAHARDRLILSELHIALATTLAWRAPDKDSLIEAIWIAIRSMDCTTWRSIKAVEDLIPEIEAILKGLSPEIKAAIMDKL